MLYFGSLTEAMGGREETLELPAGATVAMLVSVLRERQSNHPMGLDGIWSKMAVAVNREYAGLDCVLREGDEVALLPPVSGGGL